MYQIQFFNDDKGRWEPSISNAHLVEKKAELKEYKRCLERLRSVAPFTIKELKYRLKIIEGEE